MRDDEFNEEYIDQAIENIEKEALPLTFEVFLINYFFYCITNDESNEKNDTFYF